MISQDKYEYNHNRRVTNAIRALELIFAVIVAIGFSYLFWPEGAFLGGGGLFIFIMCACFDAPPGMGE